MEEYINQLLVVALATTSLLFVLSKLKQLFSAKPKLNLAPGPWTLPVIGSLHHLVRNESMQRTMRTLAKKHGPIMQVWLGEVGTVVVSSTEAAQEILRNQDVAFADRFVSTVMGAIVFNGRDLVLAKYGERWRQLRKLCTQELLTAARVKSFQHIREEEVARVMRDVAASAAAGEAVNIGKMMERIVNDIIVRCSVGSRTKYRDEFLGSLCYAVSLVTLMTVADLFPSSKMARLVGTAPRKALASRKKMQAILEKIIEERKESMDQGIISSEEAAGSESFLDVMLKLQKEGNTPLPITNELIVMLLFDMFAAGTETSANTLTWAMTELIRSPKAMAKAQSEVRQELQGKSTISEDDIVGLSYLKMVTKESLRIHSPVPFLAPRKCRETSKVMGYDVLKDTTVFVNVWAICRDGKYWSDPEVFKPERFEKTSIDYKGNNFEFLPFGSGRRMCPGMSLGIADIELPLASLLYHFDWKIPNGMKPEDIDIREAPGLIACKRTSLDLCPVAHIAPCRE